VPEWRDESVIASFSLTGFIEDTRAALQTQQHRAANKEPDFHWKSGRRT
jgi:hypothetical protein